MRVFDAGCVEALAKAGFKRRTVAHRRHAPGNRARADRHDELAAVAKLAQHFNVLDVAQPAFDQADDMIGAVLHIRERRAVESSRVGRACTIRLSDIQRHMAPEATGERTGRNGQAWGLSGRRIHRCGVRP